MVRCFSVNGIDHHPFGSNLPDNFQPRKDIFIGSIVNIFTLVCLSFQEHCLNNQVTFERFKPFNNFIYIIRSLSGDPLSGYNQYLPYPVSIYCCLLSPMPQNVRLMDKSGITQHTHLCLRKIHVTQLKRIFYNLSKMRMSCRFSVSGKSQDIRTGPFSSISSRRFFKAARTSSRVGSLLWAR